jgi:hypothetical protein
MPPLSIHNRFAVLPVEEVHELNSDSAADTDETQAIPYVPPILQPSRRPKWERRLPERYIMAANPSMNSFKLQVSIQTTDTSEMHTTMALLDLGATGLFANMDFVKRNQLTTKPLSRPIPIYNVDSLPNKAGSISEVVEVVLQYRDHSE